MSMQSRTSVSRQRNVNAIAQKASRQRGAHIGRRICALDTPSMQNKADACGGCCLWYTSTRAKHDKTLGHDSGRGGGGHTATTHTHLHIYTRTYIVVDGITRTD